MTSLTVFWLDFHIGIVANVNNNFLQIIFWYIMDVRKNAPEKKASRKNTPEKVTPGKLTPGNNPTKKIAPGKMPPRKIVSLDFFNIILQFLIFKLFIVASFRGVSRTPVVSIIDLLVTVVNGSN